MITRDVVTPKTPKTVVNPVMANPALTLMEPSESNLLKACPAIGVQTSAPYDNVPALKHIFRRKLK